VTNYQSPDFGVIPEEVILAEERTTEEEKMHIMEGESNQILDNNTNLIY